MSLVAVWKGAGTFWRRHVQHAARSVLWDLQHFPHSLLRGPAGQREHGETQGGGGETGTLGGTG